jgi:pimeloyl-ACP methyl ester carboxylesterase
VALVAVVLLRPSDGVADQSRPGAVLVLPGYGGSPADVQPIVEELQRAGRTAIAFRPTEGGTGDLRVQARRLADLADSEMDRTGVGSVDIVGYSAGGVIARIFVRDEGGASVVRRVLTLGSPHHGTDVATMAAEVSGGCPTACEQLVPSSDLLRHLNAGDETPAGPRWITVRTEEDRTVIPSESGELEGALNIDIQGVCPESFTTHEELPFDEVVLDTLHSALGSGPPRAPTDVTC